ncbi:MAG: UPF0755 protein [Parcubacteria group bacterium LiPW_41]|nr:MAG: UPF0755 protein [Parcubacteria group bacterium LiPW_41]
MRLLVVLGALLAFIFVVAYFVYSLQPSDTENNQEDNTISTSTAVQFKIEKGEGIREIASRLSSEKLIRSITVFKFYTVISGTAHRFLPGSYTISNAMSIPEIVKEFTDGGKNETTVVIPEGTTIRDVEEILAGAGVLQKGVSLPKDPKLFEKEFPFLEKRTSLEGFVFPDTYRVPLDAPPEVIVRKFLETFERKAWPILKEQDDWYNRLVLSSILEREVITFEDRQIVAGIFLKRISIRMPIQADATISYEKCDGKYKGCEVIRMARSDTAIPSPYNTYQRLGLPPTPIANPGQSAIRAAIEPQKTPYLYYLSAKTGETLFSRTLDEHNIKRAKYL